MLDETKRTCEGCGQVYATVRAMEGHQNAAMARVPKPRGGRGRNAALLLARFPNMHPCAREAFRRHAEADRAAPFTEAQLRRLSRDAHGTMLALVLDEWDRRRTEDPNGTARLLRRLPASTRVRVDNLRNGRAWRERNR